MKRIWKCGIIGLVFVFMLGLVTIEASAATVTNGWNSSKTCYYKNGKKLKKCWKKISGAKYYFGNNGKKTKGTAVIKNRVYVFNSNGKLNTKKTKKFCKKGVAVIKNKLYFFNTKGKIDVAKTAMAQYKNEFAPLHAALGKEIKVSYEYGCAGDGKDGIYEYKDFTVTTTFFGGVERYTSAF